MIEGVNLLIIDCFELHEKLFSSWFRSLMSIPSVKMVLKTIKIKLVWKLVFYHFDPRALHGSFSLHNDLSNNFK